MNTETQHGPAAGPTPPAEREDAQCALTTRRLVCGYDAPMLGPLDLAIPAGLFVLIEGPNGVGKSTLLKTLVNLQPPLSGSYRWNVGRGAVRFVPQVRTLDPILPATVADVLATGTQHGAGWGGLRLALGGVDLDDALQRVGMRAYRQRLFRELSEGQKQLVLLARALMGEGRILVLDEPAASMDPDREREALDLLRREKERRGLTILMVAHGSPTAREASDGSLRIDRERRVELQL